MRRAERWAVGLNTILATTDGGRHWAVQRSGQLSLTSVDFNNGTDGWAAGAGMLLATTDGGARWAAPPEPRCLPIRSVHFTTAKMGFAIAGGHGFESYGPPTPLDGGQVLSTSDGGRTWHVVTSPADAQTVCFTSPRDGWLGAGGGLYRTTSGGRTWTQSTAGMQVAADGGFPVIMIVECAGPGSAWALDVGLGGQMSKQAQVAYHADAAGAVPVFAGQYSALRTATAPSAYAGPFSAINSSVAAFIGWCPACLGTGTVSWDLAAGTVTGEGNVSWLTAPASASFVSEQRGWVAGATSYIGNGRYRQAIVSTDNMGRTWHLQYSS